jgi:hypothetical protein
VTFIFAEFFPGMEEDSSRTEFSYDEERRLPFEAAILKEHWARNRIVTIVLLDPSFKIEPKTDSGVRARRPLPGQRRFLQSFTAQPLVDE